MPNLADIYADDFTTYGVNLERFTNGVERKVRALFAQLQEDLVEQIHRFDLEGVRREAFRYRRMEKLLEIANGVLNDDYADMRNLHLRELRDFGSAQGSILPALLNKPFGVDLLALGLSERDLRVLAVDTHVQGAPARDWWKRQKANTRNRFATQMRIGLAEGENNQKLIRRIVGVKDGTRKVQLASGQIKTVTAYKGGVLDVSRREAEALVRTSFQSVSNQVLHQTYRDNEDVIKGEQALATLDGRTTMVCIARSGAQWGLDGEPLPESPYQRTFPGPPPWHYRCRTILIPITKSWAELAGSPPPGRARQIQRIPGSTRASMDGQVAGHLNYESWLRTKGRGFQRKILGPGRYRLWRDGELDLADLIDQRGRIITLDQLQASV